MKLYIVIGEMVVKIFLGVVLFYSSLVPRGLTCTAKISCPLCCNQNRKIKFKKCLFRSMTTEEIVSLFSATHLRNSSCMIRIGFRILYLVILLCTCTPPILSMYSEQHRYTRDMYSHPGHMAAGVGHPGGPPLSVTSQPPTYQVC